MKKVIAITIVLTLVLAAVSRGADSPKGGSVGKGEGFAIEVPTFATDVKQGETQNVTIKLQRGESFKQDVKLQIEAAKGISVEPAKVTVKASDEPDVKLMITVPKDAALGEYKVSVTGTPTTGEPTSVEFKVKVEAPEAGYTMKSDSEKGGGVAKGEGFKIAVPTFDVKVKQGETQSVTISIERGESFKQDVTLEIKLFKGEAITFDPAKVLVKASDAPDVQITVTVPKDAALGEYKVYVTGTPTTGEATSTEFKVKVEAP
jgi:uncharacterized membrane protein